jgi:single-strand DNA-binding protein
MVNKVILIGNLGDDPETKTIGETQVSKFSLATTDTWKDRNGEKQSKTEWHNCEVWGKLSGVVEKYVKKGNKLYIEGSIKYETYEKEGEKRRATKIKVLNLTMLGSKQEATQTASIVKNEPQPQQMNNKQRINYILQFLTLRN